MKLKSIMIALALASVVACDKPADDATPAAEPAAEEAKTEEATDPAAAKAEEAPTEAPAEEPATVATVGQPAPDFELADEAGNKVKLSDLKGQIVVLEWTNPDCPFVKRAYSTKTMQDAVKEAGADTKWLAIDSSNFAKPETSKKWKDANATDWPQLQDPEGKVGKLYGAKTTPHMFVIDAEGVLRYSGAIDNDPHGKLEAAQKKNYVIEAVKALTGGKEIADPETKPYGCSVKYAS